jgi:hypothetical protein
MTIQETSRDPTIAFASRMARPFVVSASTELAVSAHMRWRLGLSAFLVWRSASSEVHGIGLPSWKSNALRVFGLLPGDHN